MNDSDYLLALESAKKMAVQHGKTTYVFDDQNIVITNGFNDDDNIKMFGKLVLIATCSPDGNVDLRGKLAEIKKQGDETNYDHNCLA